MIEENIMKMRRNKRRKKMKKEIKQMLLLELGILLLVLILFMVWKLNIIRLIPPCFLYKTFGILCPACGGTRCVTNFMLGNFQESFFYHPIFFMTIVYLIIVNFIYLLNVITKKEIAVNLYPKAKFWIFFSVILVVFFLVRNIT